MVGIPGKSKGCHTCRRRKIRCDLQEPNCERCRQSGRVCEGYNRGAVFLNRTVQGLEKRRRLEEAQPRHHPVAQLPSPPDSTCSTHSTSTTTQESKPSLEPEATPVVLQLTTSSVMKKKFQSIFLETYLSSHPNDGPGLYREWLCEVIHLNHPGKLLEYSFHALCITRAGRMCNHRDLVTQGNAAYGIALRELQKTLLSPYLAKKDETLAACYILSIYELFESTSQSISGHENHLLGVERLVNFRGPRQHESPLGEALLKNICYSSMVKSLQYRKRSILKEMIDKIQWRQNDLILFAKGHTLGAMLQDLDAYAATGPTNVTILASSQYLRRLVALDVELQIWYRQLLRQSQSPLHWRTEVDGDAQGRFAFTSLQLAHLMLDFWALRLLTSATIAALGHQIFMARTLPGNHNARGPTNLYGSHQDVANLIQQVQEEHNTAHHIELATNIMESLPYCMDSRNGISSSQKCIFSSRVALFLLQRHPSEKLASYEALYMDLAVNKGLSFATGIGKTLGEWNKKTQT